MKIAGVDYRCVSGVSVLCGAGSECVTFCRGHVGCWGGLGSGGGEQVVVEEEVVVEVEAEAEEKLRL
ncbi:hypothetical protein E2C01_093496 [Portunus trituberculatus]|uniref:Uncharacterized protein n=1 Tax=Portunus trituberculatus TaxID=210409 RepID=A0A5B7JUK5_PORTR|nr:hypothetical protein [Portunus trituberculatus]